MKKIDTEEYLNEIVKIIADGSEATVPIYGVSMAPFLRDGRDAVCVRKPEKELRRGDIVLFRRLATGQYVLHRIHHIENGGYYMIGDGQVGLEGPIPRGMICAVAVRARRNGVWIAPGSLVWGFYAHFWIHMAKLRKYAGILKRKFMKK